MYNAWSVVYDTGAPSFAVIAGAFGLALLAALGIARAERIVTDRARRSTDALRRPLAPKTIMAANRGVFAGPVTITVLVPAHDEQASIGATLECSINQTLPPERLIVVADNCTDDTVAVARGHGAEVFETVDNTDKKAGGAQPGAGRLPRRAGRQRLHHGRRRRHRPRPPLHRGGRSTPHERPGHHERRRAVLRRRHRRPARPVPAQRVRALQPRARAPAGPGVRPHRHRRDLPFHRTAHGRRVTRLAAARRHRRRVRHRRAHRGQRADPGAQDARWAHVQPERVPGRHRADAQVAPPVEPTAAVATGCAREPRRVRPQADAGALLGPAAGHRLQRDRPQRVLDPARRHGARHPQLGLVPLLARHRRHLRGRPGRQRWDGGWKARVLAALLFPELAYDLFLDVVYVKGIIDITFARHAEWGHVPHERTTPGTSSVDDTDTGLAA